VSKGKSPIARALIYTAAGFSGEVAISAVHDVFRKKPVRFRTSLWMLPVYSLLLPLYEPVHDRLRARPWPLRGATYGAGFLAVEYASGAFFRRALGRVPWDYTEARFNVDDLIRLDYFFQWAAAGLALEPLHDSLTQSGDG
jgi:Putative ABC-transporter type IV